MDKELNLPLGKQTTYVNHYDKDLLLGIPRSLGRNIIGLSNTLPFSGCDFWNCYELSWLDNRGKPEVRILEFFVPFDSPNIVESKSLKLYLNSYNGTKFNNENEVRAYLEQDLSQITGAATIISINKLNELAEQKLSIFEGIYLDELEIDANEYNVNSSLLKLADDFEIIEEKLYSHLLKSNCLVTNQPDWASIQIEYKGLRIDHSSLLKYIISFRNHSEFHEQCVEHIFNDIMLKCAPDELTVYAKYTRRGGIDINPYRTTKSFKSTCFIKYRDVRQ